MYLLYVSLWAMLWFCHQTAIDCTSKSQSFVSQKIVAYILYNYHYKKILQIFWGASTFCTMGHRQFLVANHMLSESAKCITHPLTPNGCFQWTKTNGIFWKPTTFLHHMCMTWKTCMTWIGLLACLTCMQYISMITLSMMMNDSQLSQTTTWTPRRCKQGTWRHSVALGTSDAAFVRQSQTWSDVIEEYWKTLPTDQYEDPLQSTIKGLFSILGFPLSQPPSQVSCTSWGW